jgi:diguanylate cyclase (GGDEF)-like protein
MIAPLLARLRGADAAREERTVGNAKQELESLRAALNEIGDGIILLDADLRLEFINRAACEFANAPMPEPGVRPSYADLVRDANVAMTKDELDRFIQKRIETVLTGDPTPVEVRFTSGKICLARCIALADGGRLLTYSDITEVVRHNEELESMHAALDQAEYGVVLLDGGLRATFINRAFRRMAEMPDELADARPTFAEILEHGRNTNAFDVPASELDSYIEHRLQHVRAGNNRPIELRWSRGRVVRYQITPLRGGSRMLTYTDITDLAQTADQLERLATTDSLTGLFNRRHFLATTEREMNRFRRYGRPMSILLLDIDLFKTINDRFGHDVGDQMIVHVGNLCLENKRSPDIVARVGGEEFAILLPETELESASVVAERLRKLVENRPLIAGDITVPVTVSIGIAELDSTMNRVSNLMKLADRMLYDAKHAGRNRIARPPLASQAGLRSPSLAPF